jgi:tetratricopeptide (TPR) repeat protein
LRWTDRGFASGAEGEAAGALWSLRASALFWWGTPADADPAATRALALLERGSPAWCTTAGELAVILVRCDEHDRFNDLGRELLGLLGRVAPTPELVRAAMRVLEQLTFLGRSDASEQPFDALVRAAAPIEAEHPEVSAWLAELRSFRGAASDDYCEYLRASMDAARRYEQAGDLRTMCVKLSNAASTLLDLGAFEEAEAHLRRALVAADRIGIPMPSAGLRTNLAIARLRQGAVDEARPLLTHAIAVFERQAGRRVQGVARAWLARVALQEGAVEEAERLAREAVELLAVALPIRPLAYAVLVDVLSSRGAVDEALAAAREGMTIVDERGHCEEGEETLRLGLVEALLASGRKDEAEGALRGALARLRERAAHLSDAELRRSFLERVPACVRTISLAATLLGEVLSPPS